MPRFLRANPDTTRQGQMTESSASHTTAPLPAHRPLTFVHAADLHLDAAFRGIASGAPAQVQQALRRATFTAFERLVRLCCSLRPDFLLLAGDIYNHEEGSLKAQLMLRDGCMALREAGVRVFMVHGNHDPYEKRPEAVTLPDTVTVFGPGEVASVPVTRSDDDAPVAVVQGISHGSERERRNLARLFSPTAHNAVHVAMLHCTLDAVASSDIYAPAVLRELKDSGHEYWALGHIHQPQAAHTAPHVVYPGSPQGLHINESGPHGCVVVQADAQDVAASLHTVLYPLAPVLWQRHTVDIAGLETMDALFDTLVTTLEGLGDAAGYGVQPLPGDAAQTEIADLAPPEAPEGVVVRVVLTGRGPLDAPLRHEGATADLLERLRDAVSPLTPFVWIKDIELSCRPAVNMEAQRSRPDLLGEALRGVRTLAALPDMTTAAGVREALAPLFDKPKLRKLLDEPDDAELRILLEEAELLCMDLLEGDQ